MPCEHSWLYRMTGIVYDLNKPPRAARRCEKCNVHETVHLHKKKAKIPGNNAQWNEALQKDLYAQLDGSTKAGAHVNRREEGVNSDSD